MSKFILKGNLKFNSGLCLIYSRLNISEKIIALDYAGNVYVSAKLRVQIRDVPFPRQRVH